MKHQKSSNFHTQNLYFGKKVFVQVSPQVRCAKLSNEPNKAEIMFSKGFHDFYCLISVAQNVLWETSVQIPSLAKLYKLCVNSSHI